MTMLAKGLILVLAAWMAAAQRDCSRDRLRECEDGLLRNIQKRINDMNRQEMGQHCTNVREDFNCLLRETRCLTSESERNRKGDSLRNAVRYIRDGCDSLGVNWRESSCYVGDSMKACESSFPLGGAQFSSHNPETCRKFNQFQDCVMEAMRSRCRQEDDLYLGQYLVDIAQDLSWNCGESNSYSDRSRDRIRDDNGRYSNGNGRYSNGNGRYNDDRYGSDRDRDRDRDRDSDRDRDWRTSSRNRDDRYSSSNRYYGNAHSGSSDITCCRNERCDRNRMQQCRDSLSRTIDNRGGGYQDAQKCRKTRDDFNCLMWHTSTCVSQDERDQVNDIFRRARDFISRNCDTYGRWTENSCYKSTEMQRCENSLSNTRGGANYEACRAYNSFRDCMLDELSRRCTREDELFQGAYLVDKAQEMSWQCGTTSRNNGRNGYTPNDRFDGRYENTQSGSNDYNSGHLLDDEQLCLSRIDSWKENCKTKFEEKRRQLFTESDYDARSRITCCSARNYQKCLQDAVERVCQSNRNRVVDVVMGRYRHDLETQNCREIYDCSAASTTFVSFTLLSICIALVSALFATHL